VNSPNIDVSHPAVRRTLPPSTRIAHARLRVPDLDQAARFYSDLLGMVVQSTDGKVLAFSGSAGEDPILFLLEDQDPKPRDPQAPGLFHMALLYPERKDLALAFKRLYAQRWPFQGFADHGVSEALYLADPDGNGIELYIDRPRQAWPYRNGELQMVTEPLNVDDLLSALPSPGKHGPASGAGMTIGHLHLQVSDLRKAERFYHKTLGFDITQRTFPGALFMSAGGYHHHIGVNTWNSRGASPMPDGARGLTGFALELQDSAATRALSEHVRSSVFWAGESAGGFLLCDEDNFHVEILDK